MVPDRLFFFAWENVYRFRHIITIGRNHIKSCKWAIATTIFFEISYENKGLKTCLNRKSIRYRTSVLTRLLSKVSTKSLNCQSILIKWKKLFRRNIVDGLAYWAKWSTWKGSLLLKLARNCQWNLIQWSYCYDVFILNELKISARVLKLDNAYVYVMVSMYKNGARHYNVMVGTDDANIT